MADIKPKYFMYYIAAAANVGMVNEGMFLAWSSPSLVQLQAADSPITTSADQSSWIASLLPIGNVVASLCTTKVIDILGRKKTLFLTAVLASISWIITAIATTPQELYAARFIAGVGVGIHYIATTIYLTEVSPANMRGLIGGMMAPCIILGEIFIITIGFRLTISIVAWIALSMTLLFMVLIVPLPESPYFLAMKGRSKETEKSLHRLRGTTEVAEDLRTIKNTLEMNALSTGGFRDLLTKRSNLKVLGIALGLTVVQEWSGISVTIFYSYQIFSEINSSLVADMSLIPPTLRIIGSSICVLLVERTGKKLLLILAAGATSICTFIIAMFFCLRSSGYVVQPYSWIPVVAFCAHSAVLSIGLSALPNVIAGELFPMNIKAVAHGIHRVAQNSHIFIITKLYQIVSHNFGIQYPFWTYGLCTLAGVFFIKFAVPETTGKTLDEIQGDMQNVAAYRHKILPLIPKSAQSNNAEASDQVTTSC